MLDTLPKVALSIMQPWSWLIVHGFKDVENRVWRTNYRGRVLIHAGQTLDVNAHQDLLAGRHPAGNIPHISEGVRQAYTQANAYGEIGRGGIVGITEITDCVVGLDSPWFVGLYGFTLREALPLPFMPLRGQRKFFAAEYQPPTGEAPA